MSASVEELRELLLHTWRDLSGAVYRDQYIVRIITDGFCQVFTNGSLEGVAEEIIEREIAHHRSIRRTFEWASFATDVPSNLLQLLLDRGFKPGIPEVICMASTAKVFDVQDNIRVERVQDERGIADFRSVAEAVFGHDFSYTAGELADSLREGRHHNSGFVAYGGDLPVSVGRLSNPEGSRIGGLYTGGTLEAYRGQGYYRAVVAERAQFAKEIGLEYLSVDARPTSLPILLRLGFEPILESLPCVYEVK